MGNFSFPMGMICYPYTIIGQFIGQNIPSNNVYFFHNNGQYVLRPSPE